MRRSTGQLNIGQLQRDFLAIDFPEYQREPDVWSRDQKQRLIDSILRRFDISSIYLYKRDDAVLECIDGRQRLNAIMSFLGENDRDERDNGFAIRLQNEISDSLHTDFDEFNGFTFGELQEVRTMASQRAVAAVLDYPLSVVYLSGAAEPDEFNLQFLRLNLGTLINAGEKLHAMVGSARDLLFDGGVLGAHPFFDEVRIPTRRFSKEVTAAQVLLQAESLDRAGDFTRARHFDLQRFLKQQSALGSDSPVVVSLVEVLDGLAASGGGLGDHIRNRAMTVSVVLLACRLEVRTPMKFAEFGEFVVAFLDRLRWQVRNMREYQVDTRYGYLVEFQRDLTQASVEKPAVVHRHETLKVQWDRWRTTHRLDGDDEYVAEFGAPPTLT